MLPFIIWFGGVVSWFAVVGEAMIAAPLWAMTHLDGDGEGMGPRTTHGYIFLLNLIFRPVFMVIGFVLAGISGSTEKYSRAWYAAPSLRRRHPDASSPIEVRRSSLRPQRRTRTPHRRTR